MKMPVAMTLADLCQQLLGARHPEEALFTSYSIDEGEALRVALELGLFGPTRVLFRFDPSSFRAWGDSRLLPVKWLKSFRPERAASRGSSRVPAIYHPKICVLRSGNKAGIIVGTGNIGTDDLRHSRNLHCAFPLGAAEAQRVVDWVMNQREKPTLALIASEHKPVRVELTTRSSWNVFQQLRSTFKAEHEEWELVAPFWSPSVMRLVTGTSQGRVKAFFRDRKQASKVAEPSWRRGVECLIPARRERFHHKVLAWKGWRGQTCRVILYVGSANMTSAGFLGMPAGSGYNWEAGCFLIGSSSLWRIAQGAVRGGIVGWKAVPVRRRDNQFAIDAEVAPTSEDDRAGQLALWLSRMIIVDGNRIRYRQVTLPPQCGLRQITIFLDGNKRRLCANRTIMVPAGIRHAHAEGLFRFDDDGSAEIVDIDLPEVTMDPSPLNTARVVSLLRDRLDDCIGDMAANIELGSEPAKNSSENNRLATDIRFPYREFYRQYAVQPERATAWLRNVIHTGDNVPPFWRYAAKHLAESLQ